MEPKPKLFCTTCMRDSLSRVGYDIWGEGEEDQYICSCSNEIRCIVYDYETGTVEYYGIYTKGNEMEYIRWW